MLELQPGQRRAGALAACSAGSQEAEWGLPTLESHTLFPGNLVCSTQGGIQGVHQLTLKQVIGDDRDGPEVSQKLLKGKRKI